MKITWQHFGPWLRRVRTRQGLAQERLAQQIDYDRIYLWRLEKGTRCHPSRKMLAQLGRALRLAPEDAKMLAYFQSLAGAPDDTNEEGGEGAAFKQEIMGALLNVSIRKAVHQHPHKRE